MAIEQPAKVEVALPSVETPPSGTDPGGAPERARAPEAAAPRGDALWEMALEGKDWAQAPRSAPPPAPQRSRRLAAWVAGGAGALFLGAAGVWLATARVTGPPPPKPQALAPTGQVAPAPASAGRVGAGSGCSAQPVTPDPAAGTTTDVMVTGVPAGSVITLDVSYAGGTERSSVRSDSSGVSYVQVSLTSAPAGAPVQVLATAGGTSCRTSFTPVAQGPG